MFVNLLTSILTPLLVLNNCYGYYKDRKNKHYRYFFIIMCLFLSFDLLFGYITAYIPFFKVLRLVFIIWLSLPIFNGPAFVYNFYMKKMFANFEGDIDEQLENIRKVFVDSVVSKLNQAYGKYQELNGRLLTTNEKEEKYDLSASKNLNDKASDVDSNKFISDFKSGFNRIVSDENEDVNKSTGTFTSEKIEE